jgi:hypothetical protein
MANIHKKAERFCSSLIQTTTTMIISLENFIIVANETLRKLESISQHTWLGTDLMAWSHGYSTVILRNRLIVSC